jgi:hypothetical protein
MKKLIAVPYLVGVLALLPTPETRAALPLTPGDLVVVRAGDGVAGLSSSAAAVNLVEYTPAGVFVQAIPMPTAASGLSGALTLSGSATSEGFLKLSENGLYLTMAGYNAVPGTANPQTSTPTSVNRVVGRVDMSGNIDTTTVLTDAYNGSNIRSAVSSDGISIWTGGNGGSGLGSTAASRYTTLGATTSTQLVSSNTNVRVVNIFNGQLYDSASSAPFLGINTIGTGEPTTSSQVRTPLNGMPSAGTHSAYDFWFKDANTLYVADDSGVGSSGGIQKWTQSAGTWTLQYTLANNGTTAALCRGLIGTDDGLGNAVLYASTSTNSVIKVTDLGAGSAPSVLIAGVVNDAYRGISLIPIPEPTTAAIIGLGVLAVSFFRRLRR